MKFVFLIMGEFDSSKDYASIHGNEAQLIGVASIEEARRIFQIFKSLMQRQTFFVCTIYHYKFNILLPFDLADTDNVFMI